MEKINSELISLAKNIALKLDELDLKYHLTGGILSTAYGDPRFTQDIDFVLLLPQEKIPLFEEKFSEDYYLDQAAIKKACEINQMFQLLHKDLFIKIDFHVGESVPGEFSRSTEKEIEEGIKLMSADIVDSITSKLIWHKLGNPQSYKDAKGMIEQNPNLNIELLKKLAVETDTLETLEELLQQARKPLL